MDTPKTQVDALAPQILWGCKLIASSIGKSPRATSYLLERGVLPCRKVGGQTATRCSPSSVRREERCH